MLALAACIAATASVSRSAFGAPWGMPSPAPTPTLKTGSIPPRFGITPPSDNQV